MNKHSAELEVKLKELGIKAHSPSAGLLYRYISIERALEIASTNSLWFSSANHFNDPFDMSNLLIDKSYTQNDARLWIDKVVGRTDALKRGQIEAFMQDKVRFEALLEKKIDELKGRAGVCCFSRSCLKTLMWSHYANQHNGVCFGFNFLPTNRTNNLMILNTRYIENIQTLNFFKNQDIILFHWIFTKSHIWSYEEEVRAFVYNQNGLIPFDKESLEEVVFGVQVSKERMNEMKDVLKKYGFQNVRISQLKISRDTFDLVQE